MKRYKSSNKPLLCFLSATLFLEQIKLLLLLVFFRIHTTFAKYKRE